MPLLQVHVGKDLKLALHERAKHYGVPVSSLVKITLSEAFLSHEDDTYPGNIFHARRDNKGKGIPLKDLIASFKKHA